jgi:hypothetical protein
VNVNATLVEDKMRTFKGECAQFRFNKCPIYTHDGASAKFSTNSQEWITVQCKCKSSHEGTKTIKMGLTDSGREEECFCG